ncbi:LamB/YcsF family protein [Mangrovivirga sp. M17]|uniref:LamB/YcsF family protein n=1 Tax=Mangrovivirga halotolerans TaxID=2993936 RepID=A0ABT3RXE6_9BACT|nr:5-oxoprolinase subunit PxpA [Mangrovivirga halotolerans]MCX2745882.1 LamB/YcsF family protein [Mangrovivirga halotolerans]
MHKIDINCDMGESYGQFQVGNDDILFPYISSSNIACGYHGGDPLFIENTIKKALNLNLNIGAHPSYPDLAGFGRRKMEMSFDELRTIIKYQVSAVKGICESLGGKLSHVKPHGALYNTAANDEKVSLAIVSAIREIDSSLILLGKSSSQMEKVAKEKKVRFASEAFIDRRYDKSGNLVHRSIAEAVISDPDIAITQALDIILKKKVLTIDNEYINIECDSLCIHGDNPIAGKILEKLKDSFEQNNIEISPLLNVES